MNPLDQYEPSLIDRLGGDLWLILQWANALFAGVIGNINLDLIHVVKVIELRKLMAKTERVLERTWLSMRCHERRINSDPDDVRAWRDRILSISSIQHEELTSKLPHVSIGPTDANSLIAGNGRFCVAGWCTTAQIVALVVSRTGKFLKFFDVDHAKATLGCTPRVTGCRIDQFVKTVMSKVEVPVTRGELEESIVIFEMGSWISDYQIRSAHVGCRDGEAYQLMFARRDAAFNNTTGAG